MDSNSKDEENIVKVGQDSSVNGVVKYCLNLLCQQQIKEITLAAIGTAIETLENVVNSLLQYSKLYRYNKYTSIYTFRKPRFENSKLEVKLFKNEPDEIPFGYKKKITENVLYTKKGKTALRKYLILNNYNNWAIGENKNEVILKYKKVEGVFKIFGRPFINENLNKCKFRYNNKEFLLDTVFNPFESCEILEIKLIPVRKITDFSFMFCGTSLLSISDISKLNITKDSDIRNMFDGCSYLEELPDISKLDVSNFTSLSGLFANCISLKQIPDISKWNVEKVQDFSYLFYNCKSLKVYLIFQNGIL